MEIKNATLKFTGPHNFDAHDKTEYVTRHSSSNMEGIPQTGHTPMDLMLQSVAGCSGIDVTSILLKKRKTITALEIDIEGHRRDEHPRIFTKAHLHYRLTSPDAKEADIKRSIELSQDKYCGASEMFRLAGVEMSWSYELTEG